MSHDIAPPRLNDLMARYLARREADPGAMPISSEVEVYEAVPAQAVDPRQAWDGAFEAVGLVAGAKKPAQLPTGWATLIASLESMTALPMASGHFPQLVRDWLPLVKAESLNKTLKSGQPVSDVAGLTSWVESCQQSSDPAKWLLAAGLLRLNKRFDEAEKLLASKAPPKEWATAFANERAATLWQQGKHAEARKMWAKLADSAATHFNRGMSELFHDNGEAAVPHLKAAVNVLPESSAWHHLGLLYLALAQSR